MIITEEYKLEYQKYLDAKAKIEELEKIKKAAAERIIALHKEAGLDKIEEAGYKSTLVHNTRVTLLKEPLEELLGKPIPENCQKTTKFDSLKVSTGTILG